MHQSVLLLAASLTAAAPMTGLTLLAALFSGLLLSLIFLSTLTACALVTLSALSAAGSIRLLSVFSIVFSSCHDLLLGTFGFQFLDIQSYVGLHVPAQMRVLYATGDHGPWLARSPTSSISLGRPIVIDDETNGQFWPITTQRRNHAQKTGKADCVRPPESGPR